MIDPTQSLAFSMQASPGIYAVLIGSGVSRAAKIPTGWEITLDLIRKLAAVNKESCDPDPEDWYRSKFGRDADYSELLDALAKTPTERQQLLSEYIEPNEQERETGEKQPTAAHHASNRPTDASRRPYPPMARQCDQPHYGPPSPHRSCGHQRR